MLTYADGGARVGRSSLSLSHVSVASSAQADGDELAGGGMLTHADRNGTLAGSRHSTRVVYGEDLG